MNNRSKYISVAIMLMLGLLGFKLFYTDPILSIHVSGSPIGGFLFILAGIIFLLSYFFENDFWGFHYLMRACVFLSWPPKKEMSLFYAVLLIICGICIILKV